MRVVAGLPFVALILAILASHAAASPTLVETSIAASDVTAISESSAGANYGSEPEAGVGASTGTGVLLSLLRFDGFDIGSIPHPIVDVQLRIYVLATLNPAPGERIVVADTGYSGWTESNATWNNTALQLNALSLANYTQPTSMSAWVTFSSSALTQWVEDWRTGERSPENGLLIRYENLRTHNGAFSFASNYHVSTTIRPHLLITYAQGGKSDSNGCAMLAASSGQASTWPLPMLLLLLAAVARRTARQQRGL